MSDPPGRTADFSRCFPAVPSTAAGARAFLQGILSTLEDRVDQDAAALLVSELVTNVIVHAGVPEFEVRVWVNSGTVVVGVVDSDPAMPVLHTPTRRGSRGRGLPIVDRCAEQWGIAAERGGGKCIWFLLDTATE